MWLPGAALHPARSKGRRPPRSEIVTVDAALRKSVLSTDLTCLLLATSERWDPEVIKKVSEGAGLRSKDNLMINHTGTSG